MEPQITVIMPAYNVEGVVGRAIESVLSQSFQDFELLIINDGSSDSTLDVCRKYQIRDNRIEIISKKKNCGLACSRNDGIKSARGEFICFLDADDEYLPDFLKKMYSSILRDRVQLVCCGYYMVYSDNEEHSYLEKKDYQVLSRTDFIKKVIKGEISSHAWNKIYRKDFIRNITYPEGKYYEDVFAFNDLMGIIGDAAVINYFGVRYYQNPNSIVHQQRNEIEIDALKAFYDRLNMFRSQFPELSSFLLAEPVKIALRIKRRSKKDTLTEDQKKFVNEFLREAKNDSSSYKRLSMKFKIALRMMG